MLCFAVYFFKNSRFCGNYWTPDSHTNTVISHARGCLLVKMAFKTVIRPIVRSCRITAMSRKTGPGIIGILLHRKQSVGKKGSKLCYFPKKCSNTNSSKTWHPQDLTLTGASLSPLRTNRTSKWSCLSLPWININTRMDVTQFYNVSFARSLVSSRNSWLCCCNRSIKIAAANLIAASLYDHILWEQKKNPTASSL